MYQNTARSENPSVWDLQSERNENMTSKTDAPDEVEAFYLAHPEMREDDDPGMRARDANGKRHRVILFSPGKLTQLGETGRIGRFDPQYELKFDVAVALKRFSPAQRRIIFRVLVQGKSVDLVTKGSKYTARYWRHWLQTDAIPYLREHLKDYFEDEKVVL